MRVVTAGAAADCSWKGAAWHGDAQAAKRRVESRRGRDATEFQYTMLLLLRGWGLGWSVVLFGKSWLNKSNGKNEMRGLHSAMR
jgi:hypothetical protein